MAGTFPAPRPLAGKTIFFLFALVYLYAFPYFDRLRSANELPRVLTTQEIVERGTFRLNARMNELGSRWDIATTPDGRYYQNKAPGPSLLALPAYLVLKLFGVTSLRASTWAFRVTVSALPAALFLVFFYRLSARFSIDEGARRSALLAYGLGSPAVPYAVLFMSHQPAAVSAGGAFVAAVTLVRQGFVERRPLRAALVGLLAGISLMMDYQSALCAAAVAVYLLACSPRRIHDASFALLGSAIPLAVLAAYHAACFGSPLKTGYSMADPVHAQGFMGLVGPSKLAFYYTLHRPLERSAGVDALGDPGADRLRGRDGHPGTAPPRRGRGAGVSGGDGGLSDVHGIAGAGVQPRRLVRGSSVHDRGAAFRGLAGGAGFRAG